MTTNLHYTKQYLPSLLSASIAARPRTVIRSLPMRSWSLLSAIALSSVLATKACSSGVRLLVNSAVKSTIALPDLMELKFN